MTEKPKVHLLGGEGIGWALDEDLRLTEMALRDVVELTSLEEADVLHFAWWQMIQCVPANKLVGKRIICQMSNQPYFCLSSPNFRKTVELVGRWIVGSKEAKLQLRSVGIEAFIVPYKVDPQIFYPLPADHPDISQIRKIWGIPADRYLIGNFHRDTLVSDLRAPKPQKGPDVFLEIVRAVRGRGCPIHVLLAGPRRFWLREHLAKSEIPFTFVGECIEGQDDNDINILPRETLNILYNLLDLCLVSSRWEGGPHATMEAPATETKTLSSRVGLAEEILEPISIFDTPAQAVETIVDDVRRGVLSPTLGPQKQRVLSSYTPDAAAAYLQRVYADIERVPRWNEDGSKELSHGDGPTLATRITNKVFRSIGIGTKPTVSLLHTFHRPPWGGGNQFMIALRKALQKKGVRVVDNKIGRGVDVLIVNSVHFEVDNLRKAMSRPNRPKVIHRIDGPIHLYRGVDRELDDLCFKLNAEFASATVLQSIWTYRKIVEMGIQPVSPVVITNGCDTDIFHDKGRMPFLQNRKVRLISTSWSFNPNKGGDIYRWLDKNLDWDRFEYTYVGRSEDTFENIQHVGAVPSEKLAALLRLNDVYITASQNDPCSNSLLEAMSCGLPTLYLDSGGHPELVKFGGLPFSGIEDVLEKLDVLVKNFEMYRGMITAPTIEQAADGYMVLIRDMIG